jgi:hypothetical protein
LPSAGSALFHFTYAVSPLFATLTKTAGGGGYSSHQGTRRMSLFPAQGQAQRRNRSKDPRLQAEDGRPRRAAPTG